MKENDGAFRLWDQLHECKITNNEIIELFKENTKASKEKIFNHNMALIHYVIKKNFYKYITDEDLYQNAALGLLKAIKYFDVDRGLEFSTYAVSMIDGEIRRYLRDTKKVVRVSRGTLDLSKKIMMLQDIYMEKNNGKELSVEDLSKLLVIPTNRIIDAIVSNYEPLSMDLAIDSEKSKDGSEDIYYINNLSNDLDDVVSLVESKDGITKVFEGLSQRDKNIVCSYYGLGMKKKTQDEIADTYCVSQAQVSRILKAFINNVKTNYDIDKKDEENDIKKKLNTIKKYNTIYERLDFYSESEIDDELEKLLPDEKELVLKKYPKNKNTKKDKLSSAEQSKLFVVLNKLIYNLALQKVNNYSDVKDEKLNNFSNVKEKEEELNPIKQNNNEEVSKMNKNEHFSSKYLEESLNKPIEVILNAMDLLKPINKQIMELRYGLNGNKPLEISEIAKKLSLTEKQVKDAIGNTKNRLKNILEGKAKFKLDKTDKYTNQSIIIEDKLKVDFPSYSKEEILDAFSTLSTRRKEVFELYYGLNGNEALSTKQIQEKLNLTEKNVSQQLYLAKKCIKEQLSSKTKEESKLENDIEEKNNNISKQPVKDNIKEEKYKAFDNIIELIKKGKHDPKKKKYINGNLTINVSVMIGDCTITPFYSRFLCVDLGKSDSKKCYIYEVNAVDNNGNIVKECSFVVNKEENKIYEIITKDEDGLWNFDNLTKDCTAVCTGTSNKQSLDSIKEKTSVTKKMTLEEYMDSLYKNGIKLFNERKYSEAEENFAKLLEISIDDKILFDCNVFLGRLYAKRKKFILSENYFKKALSINYDYQVLLLLAKVLVQEKKYKESLNIFDECSKLNPNFSEHKIEKAKALHIMGKNSDALDILDECILFNKKGDYFAYMEKLNILFEIGKYDEALSIIDICEQKRPNFNTHKVIKGKIKYLTGNKEEALDIFDECVNIDKRNNVLFSIISIGYFFHEMGEKELAYRYYNETYMFPLWIKLTDNEIKEHISEHESKKSNDKMHSVFDVEISYDEIKELVKFMDKTGTKELYDIYQIKWPGVGHMQVDDKTKIVEDYITVFTLPFNKKVMMCYPDLKFDGKIINEPVLIEELRNKMTENALESLETETAAMEETNKVYIDDSKDGKDEQDLSEKTVTADSKKDEIIEEPISKDEEQIKPIYKDADKEVEIKFIPKEFNIPALSNFSENKENFRVLINLLSNPTQQVILLLSLGYVEDKCYSVDEISKLLGFEKEKVIEIISDGLSNITGFTSLTLNGVESARKQLRMNF